MMSGRSFPSLLLTVVVFAPLLRLHLFICPAHAAGRRILHQPLVPISWTPPPSEPLSPQPFFPGTPPQTTNPPALQQPPPAATIAVNVSSTSSRPSGGAGRKVAIGVSASVTALALLSFSACFLYQRRGRSSDGSEKLVGAGDDGSRQLPSPGRAAVAGGLLYLGTVEPSTRRVSQESNGSPYRKLRAVPALEMEHHPSPELHPMPRLTGPPRLEDSPVELSDDESFYTARRSASVTTSESPRSTVSRLSLSTVGTGKDIAACLMDSAPRSWKTSPKARLPNSDPCEVKHAILSPTRAHPPPPPPPPPPLPPRPPPPPPFVPSGPPRRGIPTPTSEAIAVQQPPPPSPPPPQSELEAGIKYLAHPGASSLPVPVRPPSRRQWVKPTSLAEAPIPPAEVGCSLPTQKVFKEQEGMGNGEKPRLKPLHWDKVRASSDRAMVWDQLKSSSFQLNEDKFEALFSTSVNPSSKDGIRRSVLPSGKQENRVLDPKKSQNIAILLRALNVTREEVSEALLDGNCEGLGIELLETLIKMAPTKEEELRLKDYAGDISKLGTAERFLKAVLDIPFAFKRIEAMMYRANFDSEVKYLRKSFRCLEEACEELRNSRLFLKLLDAVLKAGNRMNVGTVRGEARAFKLDTLLKLADVKATDGRTTLLHFVVQEIVRSEGAASDSSSETNLPAFNTVKVNEFKKQGLKMVAGLSKELGNVKKAAGIDSDVLSSYLSKLELGLEKIKMVLQLGRTSSQGKFFEAMKVFLQEAEEEIAKVKAEERTVLAIVKEITEYFHGDTAREEAHPFRIFMVVRDFLLVLDHVCKEVETTQERTIVGSARSFRIATSSSLPVLNRFHPRKDQSSDDDSSSS